MLRVVLTNGRGQAPQVDGAGSQRWGRFEPQGGAGVGEDGVCMMRCQLAVCVEIMQLPTLAMSLLPTGG